MKPWYRVLFQSWRHSGFLGFWERHGYSSAKRIKYNTPRLLQSSGGTHHCSPLQSLPLFPAYIIVNNGISTNPVTPPHSCHCCLCLASFSSLFFSTKLFLTSCTWGSLAPQTLNHRTTHGVPQVAQSSYSEPFQVRPRPVGRVAVLHND